MQLVWTRQAGKESAVNRARNGYRERIGDVAEILLGYFENNKTFQTDKIVTVPAESYVDPSLGPYRERP